MPLDFVEERRLAANAADADVLRAAAKRTRYTHWTNERIALSFVCFALSLQRGGKCTQDEWRRIDGRYLPSYFHTHLRIRLRRAVKPFSQSVGPELIWICFNWRYSFWCSWIDLGSSHISDPLSLGTSIRPPRKTMACAERSLEKAWCFLVFLGVSLAGAYRIPF